MSRKLGPKQVEVLYQVIECFDGAAPSIKAVAERVGPYGSLKYGYATVHRCIDRGLLRRDPKHPASSPNGWGAVVATTGGYDALKQARSDGR